MSREILVMVAGLQPVIRESLVCALRFEQGFRAVACEAVSASLPLLFSESFDVVVLECEPNPEDSAQFLAEVRAAGYKGAVVALAGALLPHAAASFLSSGVSAIFRKTGTLDSLVETIRTVAEGATCMDEREFRRALGVSVGPLKLSARGRQILGRLITGQSNKELASRLDISEALVKAELRRMFAIAGVRTRSQLVCLAFDQYSKLQTESDFDSVA